MFDRLDKTWIVAEIGVNHEGDVEIAKDLVRRAAAAGADAVKFQTYAAERYVSTVQPERLSAVRGRELSQDAFRELAQLAKSCGVIFFSTPLSLEDADFLDEIAPIFKIASGELTWLDLIRHVARKGKPVVISTGLATRDEIQAAVDAVLSIRPGAASNGEIMLMHCVSAYPTPAAEANLRNICWLKDEFGLPTGYSDHTLGVKACELAVALGAVAIEKHFTYRKENQAFRDHALSADPEDLRGLVAAVRRAEVYLGRYARERRPSELQNLELGRRSVAARVDIPAGKPVEAQWLTCLRPLWGIPAEKIATVIGKPLTRPMKAGDLIRQEDLGDESAAAPVPSSAAVARRRASGRTN